MRSITRRDSTSSSITSSTDSSSNYQTHPPPLLLSSDHNDHPPQHYLITSNKMKSSPDLPTDLKLGLSISTTANFSPRQQAAASDWPPIKTVLRRAPMTTEEERTPAGSPLSSSSCQMLRQSRDNSRLFVKVIMEGIRTGRKIDVLALHGYPHLVTTLEHMFTTCNILWAELEEQHSDRDELRWSGHHVLTYEDQDGDRMMVGDVPWEMFLTTVKRLKITRAVMNCSSV